MNLLQVTLGLLGSSVNPQQVWKGTRNVLIVAVVLSIGGAGAQQVPSASPIPNAENEKGSILLTVFLRHDQSKPLDQINAELRQQGYYKAFSPRRNRGCFLVCDDGNWSGYHLTGSSRTFTRGECCAGKNRLGWISNRVLSYVRLQVDW